jgi:integrase
MSVRNRDELTASEVRTLFQDALESELARAVEEFQFGTGTDKIIHNRIMAWATERALISLWQPEKLDLPQDVTVNGVPEGDGDTEVVEGFHDLFRLASQIRGEVEESNLLKLHGLPAPVTNRILYQATAHRLRGRLLGRQRAELIQHPAIQCRADQLGALLDEAFVLSLQGAPADLRPAATTSTQAASAGSIYLEDDTRRFSEVIEEVCAALQASNDWNADLSQRRRIMKSFAWVTGDKRLCDYRPSDIAKYKKVLVNLPTDFKWTDHFHLPADEVLAKFSARPTRNRRSDRTINRDLSTMSKVAGELNKAPWKPAAAVGTIMNFAEHFNSVAENDDEPDRMPWTEAHLRTFFASPIYLGGGGCGRRLKTAPLPRVWHDASYWAPLIAAYSYMSREEICGLEIADVLIDAPVPFFAVRKNMTKSLDGVTTAGLKTKNRNRVVPIHPELLRLGLADYVESVAAEGHSSLFPELYRPDLAVRGGKRFWASSFRYQVDAVAKEMELPATSKGKEADFHSFRTFGGSQFEASGTKQLTVDRILGHAPSGTGPRKYSRLRFTVEEEEYLDGLRSILVGVAPIVTADLKPAPVRHLKLEDRSRTGSAPGRRASLSKAAREGRKVTSTPSQE